MNLTDLKTKSTQELLDIAKDIGIDNVGRSRKQDIIFSILKRHAKSGEDIYGDGVLEILQDGFGFLRSAEGSYLAGPDDIYVSPSQIRRFNLRTGDSISGKIRPPKDSERYFALLKVGEVNYTKPEDSRHKILFENLTPLFPDQRLQLEKGNGSTEDLTGRIIDATQALALGLVNRVEPKENLTAAADKIAEELVSGGPVAARYAKEALVKGLDLTLVQGLGLEADLNVILQSTADRAEGIRSFLENRERGERRPPRFSGS